MLHVKVNKEGMDHKFSVMNLDRALFAFTNQAHADMNPYVPKRSNKLREDSFVRKNHIVYTTPYAKAQFRGLIATKTGRIVRIRNYTTPGTGRRWDLRAKANHMTDWRKAFIKGGGF